MAPTSIIDIQKQLNELSKSNRNLTWFTIGMFLVVIAWYTLSANKVGDDPYKQQIQALQDSITARDSRIQQEIEAIEWRSVRDSMITATNHYEIINVQNAVDKVKHKYDKERTSIAAATADSQFSYFSYWLSPTDSL